MNQVVPSRERGKEVPMYFLKGYLYRALISSLRTREFWGLQGFCGSIGRMGFVGFMGFVGLCGLQGLQGLCVCRVRRV